MTVESARHESFLLSRVVFIRPVVRERGAYAVRAGVRPRLGRRRGAGAAARPREPPPTGWCIREAYAGLRNGRSFLCARISPESRYRPCLIIIVIILT